MILSKLKIVLNAIFSNENMFSYFKGKKWKLN